MLIFKPKSSKTLTELQKHVTYGTVVLLWDWLVPSGRSILVTLPVEYAGLLQPSSFHQSLDRCQLRHNTADGSCLPNLQQKNETTLTKSKDSSGY